MLRWKFDTKMLKISLQHAKIQCMLIFSGQWNLVWIVLKFNIKCIYPMKGDPVKITTSINLMIFFQNYS